MQMLNFRKQYPLLFLAILLVIGTVCGLLIWTCWFNLADTPPPPVRAAGASPSPKPLTVPGTATPETLVAPKVPTAATPQSISPRPAREPVSPVPVAVSGSLRTLTALRAGLEETKLRAAMNELDAKMKKNESSAPVMPMAVAPPPLLPDMPPVASPRIRAGVISVQGLDGNLTATVRTGAGKTMTVRPGDRVAGMGTVTSVSRNGVAFKGESGSHTLNFD